jgi:hypothetical protein
MPRGGGGKGKGAAKTVKHKVKKLASIVTKVVGTASGSTSRQPDSPPPACPPPLEPRRQRRRRHPVSPPPAHEEVEADVEDAEEEVEEQPRASDFVHPGFLRPSAEGEEETRASEEVEDSSSDSDFEEESRASDDEADSRQWVEPEEYVESDAELLDAPAITRRQRGTSGLPKLPYEHSHIELQPVGKRYMFSQLISCGCILILFCFTHCCIQIF